MSQMKKKCEMVLATGKSLRAIYPEIQMQSTISLKQSMGHWSITSSFKLIDESNYQTDFDSSASEYN